MELVYYWKLVRRWWWLLVLGIMVFAGAGYLISGLLTPIYRATTLLLINQVQSSGAVNYQDLLTSQSLAKTYSQIVRNDTILADTIKQLDMPISIEELRDRTAVQVVGDSQLLEIAVDDPDPAQAMRTADALAQSFIARMQALQLLGMQSTTQRIDAEITEVRQQLSDTGARLSTLRASTPTDAATQADIARLQYDLGQYESRYFRLLELRQTATSAQPVSTNAILVLEPAHVANTLVQPRTARNVLLGGFLGLILAAGLAFLLEFRDDRLRSPEEVRQRFQFPQLAAIGLLRHEQVSQRPQQAMASSTEFSEAVRLLHTNLDFVTLGQATVLCIGSAMPGEGKTVIAANLAMVAAQAGKRVILIDANLRAPGMHRFFGVSSEYGLSTLLAHLPHGTAAVLQDCPCGVRLLPSGTVPPNPSELLGSQRLVELIAELRPQADLIILDSAPLLPVPDTLILQRVVDGLILVADARRTGTRTLDRAVQRLDQTAVKILGLVLNKERRRRVRYGRAYAVPPTTRAHDLVEPARSGQAR